MGCDDSSVLEMPRCIDCFSSCSEKGHSSTFESQGLLEDLLCVRAVTCMLRCSVSCAGGGCGEQR